MRYVEGIATDKAISLIGLGTWQFGSREWGYGAGYATGEAEHIVARAAEVGITVFDTAEIYGFGRSERILGAALARHDLRERAFVATKIFPVLPVQPIVRSRAEASIRRLDVDRLDLYQVHQPNPVVRDRTTMAGMRDLQRQGSVVEVGVSNYSLARWQAAEAALGSRVLSNQVQFSLAHPGPLVDLVPYALSAERLVIAFSPLGQGLLSGKYDATHQPSGGVRAANPLFLPENLVRAQALLDVLRDVAKTHAATPAQIALAWLIHHPGVIAIPGASSVAQVEANAAAADIALSGSEMTALTVEAQRFHPIGGAKAAGQLLRARTGRRG